MQLLPILQHYASSFQSKYANHITRDQQHALQAMQGCRTARYGEMRLYCDECNTAQIAFHSCGHRSCPQCQHHDTSRWLERQQQKLLPVNYFMVTFTLPFELRALTWQHQKTLYNLIMSCAVSTLKTFARNSKAFGGDIGLTAVLHTHSRKLDFHPHVHIVMPAGGLNKLRKQWRKLPGEYLFNEFNLASVFRGRLLATIADAGLKTPERIPEKWRVDCLFVGRGLPALTYLARYLYRGVINENNIIEDNGTDVTFRYKESNTRVIKQRTVKGEDFIWMILQHVLPTGFRRARDYGFLNGNARQTLQLIQLILGAVIPVTVLKKRPAFICPGCKQNMKIILFVPPVWRSG